MRAKFTEILRFFGYDPNIAKYLTQKEMFDLLRLYLSIVKSKKTK